MNDIKIYLDEACSKEIKSIKWDSEVKVKLIDGSVEVIENAVESGEVATATFYLRNEGYSRFLITDCSFEDKRLKCEVETPSLENNQLTKIIVQFKAPKSPQSEDIVKEGKIKIEGYSIID